jgi:hypothetical protein
MRKLRTQDEILERIKAKQQEFLCFEPEVLFEWLDYEHAKGLLKPEVTKDKWDSDRPAYKRANVLARAYDYMAEYGWPKARDHRGISASRTVQKLTAWVWLAGEDELLDRMAAAPYENYGAPILKLVADHFGWPMPKDEALERMARGEKCHPECCEGCGQ